MLNRRTVIQASLGGGLVAVLAGPAAGRPGRGAGGGWVPAWGGLAGVGHERGKLGPTDGAGWHPVAWPFPRDGWPPGRGWRRDTTDVHVRPKLRFCANCGTGRVPTTTFG